MIKLNRTTEYGLMALRHMSRQQGDTRASAREISDVFGLPFEITAKTLQRLKDAGLIRSVQGAHGGYVICRPLDQVTLAEFLGLMEGPQFLVDCADTSAAQAEPKSAGGSSCQYSARCEIKHIMSDLNSRIYGFLSGIRLTEILEDRAASSELGGLVSVSSPVTSGGTDRMTASASKADSV